MDQQEQLRKNEASGISVGDFADKFLSGIRFIARKWHYILICAVFGAALGFCYSLFQKPNYTANCSFVLEETNKAGSLSQYAGLANLAGFNLAGGGSGIFEGDNIIELYKSRLMIQKALLSEADFNGKNELLIDRFADYYQLRNKWKKNDQIDSITFNGNPEKFNRKQDSLIGDLVDKFNRKFLNVIKPDKKLNIIDVYFTSKDELFAKAFTNALVQMVNDFYIVTKTKKASQNVEVLQRQADSVRRELNSSIAGVASAIDAAPNANPLMLSLRVPSQKKQIDVQASTAIYAEIVKNLEISRISLQQEMPLIQIIDQPILPLKNDRVTKTIGTFAGFIIAAIISAFFIAVKRMLS